MNNYERIKNMTFEEMAEFICDIAASNCCNLRPTDGVICLAYQKGMCETGVKEYLESESEVEE